MPEQRTRLSAGHLGLDFVNTVHPRDFLTRAADLIHWSRTVGLITEERAQALLAETAASPEESSAVFAQALALREASYRVLLALIHQTPPDFSEVQVVQSLLAEARNHECLIATDGHLAWQWEPGERGLAHLYWPLARAVELVLTAAPMGRVKECPPSKGGCGWFFLDRSKNNTRQWCSDQDCGSRVRMRRLYARKQANKAR